MTSNPSLTSSLKAAYVAGLTFTLTATSAMASVSASVAPTTHAVKKSSNPLFWLALGTVAIALMVVFIRRASKGLTMRIKASEDKSEDS